MRDPTDVGAVVCGGLVHCGVRPGWSGTCTPHAPRGGELRPQAQLNKMGTAADGRDREPRLKPHPSHDVCETGLRRIKRARGRPLECHFLECPSQDLSGKGQVPQNQRPLSPALCSQHRSATSVSVTHLTSEFFLFLSVMGFDQESGGPRHELLLVCADILDAGIAHKSGLDHRPTHPPTHLVFRFGQKRCDEQRRRRHTHTRTHATLRHTTAFRWILVSVCVAQLREWPELRRDTLPPRRAPCTPPWGTS